LQVIIISLFEKVNKTLFEGGSSFFIFSLFLLLLFSRAFPDIKNIYFFIPFFFVSYIFFGTNNLKKNAEIKKIAIFVLIFSLWSGISLFWSQFPLFTLKRSIYFGLVVLGSLIIGYNLAKKDFLSLLKPFVFVNILIIVSSLYSLIFNTPETAWTGGHGLGFMGYAHHQNKFAQYLFLTAAPLVLILHNYKTQKKIKYFISLLLILNIIFISLSVSRGAILGLFLTWFIFYLVNFSFLKSILFLALFTIIVSATIFITSEYFDKEQITIVKHENSFGERRYKTIIDSWDSAINGSFFGLGYGISDERFKHPELGYIDKTDEGDIYRREKTISVLALIEEVGIIGLGFLLLILIYPIILLWQRLNLSNHKVFKQYQVSSIKYQAPSFLIFTFAFLISLNIYAQIESWWIGIGSAVLPVYFVFVGASLNDKLN